MGKGGGQMTNPTAQEINRKLRKLANLPRLPCIAKFQNTKEYRRKMQKNPKRNESRL